MVAEQVQLTGKAPEGSFQNTIRVAFGPGLRGTSGRFVCLYNPSSWHGLFTNFTKSYIITFLINLCAWGVL